MKRIIVVLLLGILAGMMISFGGYVNVYSSLKYNLPALGAILFTTGLIFISLFKLNLFTGKAGYIFENNKNYLLDVFIMMIGNFIGTFIIGIIFLYSNSIDKALLTNFINNKVINFNDNNVLKIIFNSILAGIFVFLAVECYKRFDNYLVKIIGIVFPISIMVLIGAEHSVANGFYFFGMMNYINFDEGLVFLTVIINIFGNILGSLSIWSILKLVDKLSKKSTKSI